MISLRCKGIVNHKPCDRFLKIEPKSTFIADVTCPDRQCKFVNHIKIVTNESSDQELRFKFEEK